MDDIERELEAIRRAWWDSQRQGDMHNRDELELLRMLREAKRFITIPVPEEHTPF